MTMQDLDFFVRRIAIWPILMPRSVGQCLETVAALAEGGAQGVEVVLRGPDSMSALRAAAAQFPTVAFAAGTVLTPSQYDEAVEAGASLTISPGLCPNLVDHAYKVGVPLVPGVQTATEIMAARRSGLRMLKFYPSEPAGGRDLIRDLCSMFPDTSFMPSGKITLDVLPGYAVVRGVASVGGTWMHSEKGHDLARAEVVRRMRASLDAFQRAN